MGPAREGVPERILRGFFVVEGLLVARYNAALEAVGAPPTERSRFRIDAAGYSPEVADDLDDAFYLGGRELGAHGLILSVEQLEAPLVHPGLGHAADAFREVTSSAIREISSLTLREAIP